MEFAGFSTHSSIGRLGHCGVAVTVGVPTSYAKNDVMLCAGETRERPLRILVEGAAETRHTQSRRSIISITNRLIIGDVRAHLQI
eukprot:1750090-Rhodomonas_salina.1